MAFQRRPELRTNQQEVQRTVEPLGGNRYRVTETKTVTLRPELASALFGGAVPIGITASREAPAAKKSTAIIVPSKQSRPHYESREALMKDKKDGLISGHEWWFRPEYMRLSQNKRRHSERTRKEGTGARKTDTR
jgi:hypothetical protein